MKNKLTLSFAKLVRTLLDSDLNAADFSSSNKRLLDQFLNDNVLDYRLIGKQQRKIFCPDANNLSRYLHHKFEIPSLDGYINFLEMEDVQRSDAVKAVADTKFRKTKVFTGFLVNCYDEIICELYDRPFLINPIHGAHTFISAYQHFQIPADVTVIVVEGHENFREIARQKYLFEGLRPLFVWRYQNSTAIASWLNAISNSYIHFGDFDPKGIHIYLTEFKNKIQGDRGQFLIPPDIESLLIQHGEKELYEKQKKFTPLIRVANQPELLRLLDIIVKHKKGLAQEVLIK
jgi:hypothetical protein